MIRGLLAVVVLCGWCVFEAVAEPTAIRMQGREDVVVTKAVVQLQDIAQIESPRVQDDEMLITLKRIVVGSSPKVGEKMTIEGTDILAKLRSEGVRLDQIRYSLPRQVVVTRAFREVTTDELELALASFLEREDRQIDVKKLVVERPVRIPPDSDGVEVVALSAAQPGRFGVDFRSRTASDEVRFQLRAIGDEWRLMPVAAKPLKRGEVVSGEAVELMKMSSSVVGRDTVENISDIVGHAVTRDLGQGELFRVATLSIPPVVRAGARVTLLVKHGRLEASATGVALENGGIGQEIKVRNDVSKRMITGKVVEEGLVSVEVR